MASITKQLKALTEKLGGEAKGKTISGCLKDLCDCNIGGGSGGADWSQNDPEGEGYVKNRTHYANVRFDIKHEASGAEGYVKVSDETPTKDELIGGEITYKSYGTVYTAILDQYNVVEKDGYLVCDSGNMVVVLEDNTSVENPSWGENGGVVLNKGMYFSDFSRRFTTKFFCENVLKLAEKYIPDSLKPIIIPVFIGYANENVSCGIGTMNGDTSAVPSYETIKSAVMSGASILFETTPGLSFTGEGFYPSGAVSSSPATYYRATGASYFTPGGLRGCIRIPFFPCFGNEGIPVWGMSSMFVATFYDDGEGDSLEYVGKLAINE